MKPTCLFLLILTGIIIYFFNIGIAEEMNNVKTLSIQQAIGKAMANNQALKAAREGLDAADARVDAARSEFLPKVNLHESFARTNNPPTVFTHKLNQEIFVQKDFDLERLNNPSPISNWQTRLEVIQPLFNQGKELTGYRLSRLNLKAASLELASATQLVTYWLEETFYRAILTDEAVEVLSFSVKISRESLSLAEKREREGLALKSDVLSAQAYLAKTEREKIKAEGEKNTVLSSLNQVMGVPQDEKWDLILPEDEIQWPEKNPKDWIATALKNRPELGIAGLKEEEALTRKKQAFYRFLPSLNFSGAYEANSEEFADSGGDSWSVMATASINLFSGLGDRASIRAAEAEARQVSHLAEDTRAKVELEVREAFNRLETAKKQNEVTERALKSAEESYKILKKRYENGLALMVELLAAETALKEAKLQDIQAKFDLRMALSMLRLKAGILISDQ